MTVGLFKQFPFLTEYYIFCFVSAVDLDLCSSNVQDAFVIAVEQQARERLERLSALKRVTPVDITKLSQQVHYIFKHNFSKELILVSPTLYKIQNFN